MGDDITIGVTEIVNNIEVTAQPNDQIVDISVTDNADNVTLNITPTVVEVNINKGSSFAQWGDLYGTLSDQTDLQNALNLKANLVDGKVPASELPSYVDDIIEVANYAALPATGEIGKIYVTLDNNKIYRWSGSIYIEIASNSAIWGAITGTLTDQTDLVTALNAKQNTITLTTTGTTGAATLVGSTLNIPNYTTDISGLVPYTGATTNVDLGTYKLTASDLVINHASGSGVAASITKGGNGEALTVVKSSGSGNAASITGGTTLLSELHLTTDLADDYIASAATWNAKQAALNGTGFVKASGTTISYDNTTYLSGTVAIANGGTGATTAGAALTNLGGTTVGTNIFTSANPSPYTSAYLKVKPDNSVEWLEANAFRIAIGAGTGNGTVTSVEAVGSYGGLTLTGTVTGSGQITLGGTPEGTWPISISGNASSVNTVQVSTNADFYLTFADANNGSPTSEFLYTIGSVKVNPSTGALTAGSFVKSGGTSSQYLMADGSVSTGGGVSGSGTTNYIPKFTGANAIGNSSIFDNGQVNIGSTSFAGDELLMVSMNGTTNTQAINVKDRNASGNGSTFMVFRKSDDTFLGNIRRSGTSDALYIGGNSFLALGHSGNTEAMRITSGGSVGIGTTSPSEKLEVVGGGFAAGNGTIKTGITYSSLGLIGTFTNHDFGLLSNGTERMRITSGGNVGIGTTSPSTALDVNGVIRGLMPNDPLSGAITAKFLSFSGNPYGLIFRGYATGAHSIQSQRESSDSTLFPLSLQPLGGNVGIGTTSPDSALTVGGSSGAVTTPTAITMDGTYRTGALSFDSLKFYLYKSSTETYGFGLGNLGEVTYWAGSSSSGTHAFYTSKTERMRITSGGNVGIGTTDIPNKLTVSSGGTSAAIRSVFTNNTAYATNDYSGIATVVVENTSTTGGTGAGILFLPKTTTGACIASIGAINESNSYASALVFQTRSSGGTDGERMRIASSGATTFTSTVTATGFFNSSDNRLKDLTDYDYNVSDIKPITYLWKDGRDNKKHVGYSAQEVQKVMPDAVNEDEKGMLSVNYVEVLVAKIAELENRIKQLEK